MIAFEGTLRLKHRATKAKTYRATLRVDGQVRVTRKVCKTATQAVAYGKRLAEKAQYFADCALSRQLPERHLPEMVAGA